MIYPPPNPKAEQARAEMQAYSTPLLQNPPRCAPPAPSLSDALASCLTRWPDMARYADTARVETLWDARAACWRGVVTVTCFEREAWRVCLEANDGVCR